MPTTITATTPKPAITPATETESPNHLTLAAKLMRLASRAEDKELEFLDSLIDSCINERGTFDIKESTFRHVTSAFGFYFPEPGDELDRYRQDLDGAYEMLQLDERRGPRSIDRSQCLFAASQ